MNGAPGSRVRHARQPHQHRQGPWPTAISAVYLVLSVSVAAAEYLSEMAKINRGTETDTFSPFLFIKLLTLPTSAAHPAWHGYPAQFSAAAYRHAVRSAAAPTAVNIVVNTAVIYGTGVIWVYLHRHARA